MYADDGVPFRTKMIQYIEREFADLLGPQIGLLKSDAGLELLSSLHSETTDGSSRLRKAA